MEAVSVEARNIELSYGTTKVLRDISLTVLPGEFFALLGPSGSGKSTLLRLIAGFNQHQAGQLLVGGRDVTGVPPWKRNVGMVFQNYALWPHMTVAKNVAFGLEERKLPRDEIRKRVDAALALVGLSEYRDRRPNQLSGGQQQRVALARTIAVEPQVLLLDEPLSNLDAKLRVQMRHELRRLHDQLGITTIFVTHDQEEALTMCDRIAVMDQGVIQQIGTPEELFDRPVNRFVAQFVGSVNLVEGAIRREAGRSVFASALGDRPLPGAMDDREGRVELAFRPHAVIVHDEATANPDALELEGVIETGEFLGEFVRYEIRVGESRIIADQPHLQGSTRIEKGKIVRLSIPRSEIRLI
ncbi:ABC transporter ATP-binding protein [Usitatibacter palustris]|uniref:Spermidine/putrescine import ATP-binding protein PotA n=1 Tax=Usitatibacter palustris TaxID=2732487 RepID=A0A6M4HBS0_9PROT|nr:ABC transporter ATP-binding protein [Usitatibacter palustris]QJR15417.1 Sulfate/thiosulfate import ATP-binding protein CysA [Usitatibacter palustris]